MKHKGKTRNSKIIMLFTRQIFLNSRSNLGLFCFAIGKKLDIFRVFIFLSVGFSVWLKQSEGKQHVIMWYERLVLDYWFNQTRFWVSSTSVCSYNLLTFR